MVALKACATKRERYGPRLMSERGHRARVRALRAAFSAGGHNNGRKTHCKHGHLFDAANTYRTADGRRHCRLCVKRRQGATVRPTYVFDGGARINVTVHDRWYRKAWRHRQRQRIAAHPDTGGTARAFRCATEALQQFEQIEGAWYARFGLAPPARQMRLRQERKQRRIQQEWLA